MMDSCRGSKADVLFSNENMSTAPEIRCAEIVEMTLALSTAFVLIALFVNENPLWSGDVRALVVIALVFGTGCVRPVVFEILTNA